jgi:hypothetical protein
MTSITHGSIAEYEEREALKEHLAGLIAENKRFCEQIETLKVNEQCINKSKEYAFEDLRACQAREAKLRELVNQCFERPLLSCGPLIEQMAEELK